MYENPYQSPETYSQRPDTEPEHYALVDYFRDEGEGDYPLVGWHSIPGIAFIAGLALAWFVLNR